MAPYRSCVSFMLAAHGISHRDATLCTQLEASAASATDATQRAEALQSDLVSAEERAGAAAELRGRVATLEQVMGFVWVSACHMQQA